ncbi:MAG: GAF domain-containing protein [Chromatiales bacterium]|jgi:signal transduction histidine kinase
MLIAPLPDNEEARIKQLYDLDILDTFEEQAYDDLTYLAAQICDAPISLISLIDRDRQFLKSHYGLDVNEVSRDLGFCPHAILDNDLTIIEDSSKDERFYDNPLVTGAPHVNFYAGAPLIFPGDLRIGTLCIVDHKARSITPEQQHALQALARQVVSQLELRKSLRKMEISEARKQSHASILEKLAKGNSLETVLQAITHSIEQEIEGAFCSILILEQDGKRLRTGAAPALPDFYNEAIQQLEVGAQTGGCGAAAHSGERVIVDNISAHPFWQPLKQVTDKLGLASCWSEPIFDSKGNVLGAFAIYFSEPRTPQASDINSIEHAANLAGIAIQQKHKEESLIRAERLAVSANIAKSEFLSNMSHELRTPLNAIMGFGQLLEMTSEDSATQQNAGEIVKAGRHLLELISDILDLSTIEAGKLQLAMQHCRLGAVVDECLSLVRPLAQKQRVRINNNITDTTRSCVHVDPVRLKQVLLNLLSNAIKYNLPDGTVTLESEVVDDKFLRIQVNDTGKGLTRQQQQKLFQPFERLDTDKSIEGTGIGLAISKRLIELMGASMGYASQQGQGSSFWVQLELSQDDRPEASRSEPDASDEADDAQSSDRKSILYVEDNPANLNLVKQVVERYTPYNFIPAADAETGLVLAREQVPDLILMDINLPGMDGYTAIQQLQADAVTQHIPVIVVSANALPDDIEKGKQAGCYDYLTKPINMKALLDMLKQLLG